MNASKNFFNNKKILIYGMGKSGFSSYHFLKKKIILKFMTMKKKLLKINQ